MRPSDAAYAALGEADPDVMDRDELAALTRDIARVRAWCDSVQVRVTRRQRALAAEGRAELPSDLLAREGRQSGRDARTADDRERVCTAIPGFEDAMASGTVSAGHVDALASVTRNLDPTVQAEVSALAGDLVADAEKFGVDQFERNCRDLVRNLNAVHAGASAVAELEKQRAASKIKRWTDRETGMRQTLISLDPVRDKAFWNAVTSKRGKLRQKPENAKLPWNQLEVQALIAAIGGGGDRVPMIHVLIDETTLATGMVHERTVCETDDGAPLPVETVRNLCCDAHIVPIIIDGKGQALAVGRTQRVATLAQRAALGAMHRTCVGSNCTVSFDDCYVHHIVPWTKGGFTDLDNLLPLCDRDHHLVHEGGWKITMTADRVVTWTRPDGTVYATVASIDRAPHGVKPVRAA
jgi:hypothetical protein